MQCRGKDGELGFGEGGEDVEVWVGEGEGVFLFFSF
jgi:hypothetical protein